MTLNPIEKSRLEVLEEKKENETLTPQEVTELKKLQDKENA
jgi:hypothetical protein